MCDKGSYIALGTKGLMYVSHNGHRAHCYTVGAENQLPHCDLYMCAGHVCTPSPHTANVIEILDKHNKKLFLALLSLLNAINSEDFYKPGTGHIKVKLKGWEDSKRTGTWVPSTHISSHVWQCVPAIPAVWKQRQRILGTS